MVRAGVVKHPQEWIHSGYNEIQSPRQRYGIIDFKNLMALLQIENFADLKEAHRKWIEEALKKSKVVRQSKWTQSIAVGDKSFLEQIKDCLGIRAKGRKIHGSEDEYQLREGQADYGGWQDLDNENIFDWNLAN
jgi:putative transposase